MRQKEKGGKNRCSVFHPPASSHCDSFNVPPRATYRCSAITQKHGLTSQAWLVTVQLSLGGKTPSWLTAFSAAMTSLRGSAAALYRGAAREPARFFLGIERVKFIFVPLVPSHSTLTSAYLEVSCALRSALTVASRAAVTAAVRVAKPIHGHEITSTPLTPFASGAKAGGAKSLSEGAVCELTHLPESNS